MTYISMLCLCASEILFSSEIGCRKKRYPLFPATSDLNSIAPSGIFCTMRMQPLATLGFFTLFLGQMLYWRPPFKGGIYFTCSPELPVKGTRQMKSGLIADQFQQHISTRSCSWWRPAQSPPSWCSTTTTARQTPTRCRSG